MTLDELGDRLFADIPQAASILGRDERTVRRAAAAGGIPANKVGTKWMIPTAWLRQQAGVTEGRPAAADLDELAARLVDRLAPCLADQVFARLAGLFAARGGGDTEAA